MDWRLELVIVPVSDVDRAKAFYTESWVQRRSRPRGERQNTADAACAAWLGLLDRRGQGTY
jgi:hypothetical protein